MASWRRVRSSLRSALLAGAISSRSRLFGPKRYAAAVRIATGRQKNLDRGSIDDCYWGGDAQ